MKYLLILITLIFISCDSHTAPTGMTHLIQLPDGRVIESINYEINHYSNNILTFKYNVGDSRNLKVSVVPYEPNYLYNLGYKQGQIDAIERTPCYAKVLTNDGEVLWKDTCAIKRKPKI